MVFKAGCRGSPEKGEGSYLGLRSRSVLQFEAWGSYPNVLPILTKLGAQALSWVGGRRLF